MEITILELVTKYGFNTVIIASMVFLMTGLIKKPIKLLAKKLKDGTHLTRYITFLPIILGFGITTLYTYILQHNIVFDGNFFTLWLTSSSLSLAIYAFMEKFIPSKNKILSEIEVKQNEELIAKIKETILPKETVLPKETSEEAEVKEILQTKVQEKPLQKIILRGNGNGEAIDAEKEQL